MAASAPNFQVSFQSRQKSQSRWRSRSARKTEDMRARENKKRTPAGATGVLAFARGSLLS